MVVPITNPYKTDMIIMQKDYLNLFTTFIRPALKKTMDIRALYNSCLALRDFYSCSVIYLKVFIKSGAESRIFADNEKLATFVARFEPAHAFAY